MSLSKYHALVETLTDSDDYWSDLAKLEIATELNRIMRSARISRKALAERIGKSPAYVSKALRGDANLTIETIVKFARALDCRVAFAMGAPQRKEQDLFVYWTKLFGQVQVTTVRTSTERPLLGEEALYVFSAKLDQHRTVDEPRVLSRVTH